MERIPKMLSFQAKYLFASQNPYKFRIKFLGKRSNLTHQDSGHSQSAAPLFKHSLADFKHVKSTFIRQGITQQEIDIINQGGEDVPYKHIPKIKLQKQEEEDF